MPVGVGVRYYRADLSAVDRWMKGCVCVWGGGVKVMAGHKARVMRGRLCL